MRKRLFIILIVIFPTLLIAQPFQQWAANYNGPKGTQDFGRSFVIDTAGNSYIVGSSDSTGTNKDIAVIKYDSLGNQVWVARYNGNDNLADWGYAIVIDNSGNIYVTGETGTTANSVDFITIKYNNAGVLQWSKTYNGTGGGNDAAVDIALDNNGNIFVAGKSVGSGSLDDYLTIKYDNNGNEIWVERYDGTGNNVDEARTIHTDSFGNVYVSGGSIGTTSDYDFVTIKYNNAGTLMWSSRYNGLGNGYDLVFYQGSLITDSLSNVYICGYSTGLDSIYEYTIVKYDSLGNQLWDARLGGDRMGKDDFTDAITLDDSLNIYITGAMYDSINDYDIITVKYNSSGVFQWQAAYDGIDNDWDEGYGIIVDNSGNVFVGGRSNKASFSGADFVIIKYDNMGVEQWNVRYSRGGFSWPFKLRMDNQNNLFIGGWSSTSSPATADFTVVKYGPNPVGIQESITDKNNLVVWPNPSNGEFRINGEFDFPVTIRVYNMLGKLIKLKVLESTNELISFRGLNKGIYLLELRNNEIKLNQRVVIE